MKKTRKAAKRGKKYRTVRGTIRDPKGLLGAKAIAEYVKKTARLDAEMESPAEGMETAEWPTFRTKYDGKFVGEIRVVIPDLIATLGLQLDALEKKLGDVLLPAEGTYPDVQRRTEIALRIQRLITRVVAITERVDL